MEPNDLLATALRASLVYVIILFVIRLMGKRAVGNLTAFDLLVALMLGEVVDEIIFGDVTMLKGVVAVATIAVWHLANEWGSAKSQWIDRITGSSPDVVVENGQIKRDALAKERMNEDELWSQLRIEGIEDLNEIKRATIEPSGHVSVIKQEWARELQKRDLARAKTRVA